MKYLIHLLFFALQIGLVSALPVAACQFHTNLPALTISDRLRLADIVVLAREDGNRGFDAIESLRGKLDGIDIPFLADSATVRRLAKFPNDSVLFTHDPDLDEWQRLAYVDSAMRPIIADLFSQIPNWTKEYGEERFRFFAALHDHPNKTVRRMAHMELDKAPYRLLRSLDLRLNVDDLRADLWRLTEVPWIPFKYLLLGISGHDTALYELERTIDSADETGEAKYLGPAATALIEITGKNGIAKLERLFFSDPHETERNVEQVVQAMVIHHEVGNQDLRDRIDLALSQLFQSRSEMAAFVAKELTRSRIWSLAEPMRHLLNENVIRSPFERHAIRSYLYNAHTWQMNP